MENIPQSKEDGTVQDIMLKENLVPKNDEVKSSEINKNNKPLKNPLISSISKNYKGVLRTSSKKTLSIPIRQKRSESLITIQAILWIHTTSKFMNLKISSDYNFEELKSEMVKREPMLKEVDLDDMKIVIAKNKVSDQKEIKYRREDQLTSIPVFKELISMRRPLQLHIYTGDYVEPTNIPIEVSGTQPTRNIKGKSSSLPNNLHLSSSNNSSASFRFSIDTLTPSSYATLSSVSTSFSTLDYNTQDSLSPPSSLKQIESVGSIKLDSCDENDISQDIPSDKIKNFLDTSIVNQSSNIIKSGVLYIKQLKSSYVKNDYYFVLKSNYQLLFSKDEDMNDLEPKNKLSLTACSIVPSDISENEFEIVYGLRRIYVGAESIELAMEWRAILQRYIREAKEVYSQNISFEGWLYKRGETIKSWRKRWCIIKEGIIYYYEDPFTAKSSFLKKYKGCVDISDCWVTPDDDRVTGFKIHTENRTWVFYSNSQDESRQWMNAINEEKALRIREHSSEEDSTVAENYRVMNRKIYVVREDVETTEQITSYIDLLNIKSMMEIDQFRYVRWVLALLRYQVHEEKYEKNILDIVFAETTNITSHFIPPDKIFIEFKFDGSVTRLACDVESTLKEVITKLLNKLHIKESADNFVIRLYGQRKYIFDIAHVKLWNIVWVRDMIRKGKVPIEFALERKADVIEKTKSLPPNLINEDNVSQFPSRKSVLLTKLDKQTDEHEPLQNVRSAIKSGSYIGKKYRSPNKSNYSSVFEYMKLLGTETTQEVINVNDIHNDFLIKVVSVDNFSRSIFDSVEQLNNAFKREVKLTFFVEIGIYYGGELLCPKLKSDKRLNTFWNQILDTHTPISMLPPETRLCFTLYCHTLQKDTPLAWVNCTLTDFTGQLKSGEIALSMWLHGAANPLGTTEVNPLRQLILNVNFITPQTNAPIAFPEFIMSPSYLISNFNGQEEEENQRGTELSAITEESFNEYILKKYGEEDKSSHSNNFKEILRLSKLDLLYELKKEEKEILWRYRDYLLDKEEIIPKLLLSAKMQYIEHRKEIERIVTTCPLITPEAALQLLDYKYADIHIRSYSVRCLSKLNDESLSLYLLQLVQVLKYESFHVSKLACFLLERALKAPLTLGYSLFWLLQSESHLDNVSARFKLLQEAILLGVRAQIRDELLFHMDFVNKLSDINAHITKYPPPERKEVLVKVLEELELPPQFTLPLDSTIILKGVNPQNCKIMESAAHPMMIEFENSEVKLETYCVLCKFGDDLRQDCLTLQLFKFMDKQWKKHGLDLQMSIYGCVPTGKNMGLIEIMKDSETTARIQKDAHGILGAFKQTPLHNWLKSFNASTKAWEDAKETFLRSCAAYCVATYVIGIGDRHNDNIMVTKSGALFHIDFAHFLGNIMKFGVYKREKAPFVFTPEFAYVMGGEKAEPYKRFVSYCCKSYKILRQKTNIILSLFGLMLFAGIPQLSSPSDIQYLKKSLAVTMSEEESEKHFIRLIDESLRTKITQINFAIHIMANRD